MPETAALADRIRKYRDAQEKNQFDMASEMGLSTEEISLLERGKTDPKLSTLQKIAAHMGITVSELLKIDEEEERR